MTVDRIQKNIAYTIPSKIALGLGGAGLGLGWVMPKTAPPAGARIFLRFFAFIKLQDFQPKKRAQNIANTVK